MRGVGWWGAYVAPLVMMLVLHRPSPLWGQPTFGGGAGEPRTLIVVNGTVGGETAKIILDTAHHSCTRSGKTLTCSLNPSNVTILGAKIGCLASDFCSASPVNFTGLPIAFTLNGTSTPVGYRMGDSHTAAQSGATLEITGGDFIVDNTGNASDKFCIRGPSNGWIGTLGSTSTNHLVCFKAGNMSSDVTFTWPTADGSSAQLIKTNGSGVFSFTSNAPTATALAADGSDCSANQAAGGVDTLGASQNCIAPPLLAGIAGAQTLTLSTNNNGTFYGSGTSGGTLTIGSTSNSSKGGTTIGSNSSDPTTITGSLTVNGAVSVTGITTFSALTQFSNTGPAAFDRLANAAVNGTNNDLPNNVCTGSGAPNACCTGSGTGTCTLTASAIRITGPSAAFTITGFAPTASAAGQFLILRTTVSHAMTIANQNTGTTTAADRIITQTGADVGINCPAAECTSSGVPCACCTGSGAGATCATSAGATAMFWYDPVTLRWILLNSRDAVGMH